MKSPLIVYRLFSDLVIIMHAPMAFTTPDMSFWLFTHTFQRYVTGNRSPWWRHQMETFSALLAICAGNSPVIGEFPAQRPVTLSFHVFFDLINDWVKNRKAGGLRRHRAHYEVIVMRKIFFVACACCRVWYLSTGLMVTLAIPKNLMKWCQPC